MLHRVEEAPHCTGLDIGDVGADLVVGLGQAGAAEAVFALAEIDE